MVARDITLRKSPPTLALALEQIGRADTGIGFITASTFALCSTFAFKTTFQDILCKKMAPLFCQDDQVVLGSLILPVYGREDAKKNFLSSGVSTCRLPLVK